MGEGAGEAACPCQVDSMEGGHKQASIDELYYHLSFKATPCTANVPFDGRQGRGPCQGAWRGGAGREGGRDKRQAVCGVVGGEGEETL